MALKKTAYFFSIIAVLLSVLLAALPAVALSDEASVDDGVMEETAQAPAEDGYALEGAEPVSEPGPAPALDPEPVSEQASEPEATPVPEAAPVTESIDETLSDEGLKMPPAHIFWQREKEAEELKKRVETLELEVNELRNAAQKAAAFSPERASSADEDAARTALERTIIEKGGLLLNPWSLEVAPGFSYIHSSSEEVIVDGFTVLPVLVVGDITSERVRRDTYMPSLTLRLGLPKDLQAEVYVPYSHATEKIVTSENEETGHASTGFGDIEAGLTWQAFREKGWFPDLLTGLRWKTTTGRSPFGTTDDDLALGTGFNGVQATVTMLKLRDPLALYAGLSYTANLAAHKTSGRIDPGDTAGFQLGMGLSLNPDTSINFGWDQRFTGETTLQGEDVPGTNLTVGMLRVGASYILSRKVSLDVSLGIGITADAPDMQATVSIPVKAF